MPRCHFVCCYSIACRILSGRVMQQGPSLRQTTVLLLLLLLLFPLLLHVSTARLFRLCLKIAIFLRFTFRF